MARFIIQNMIYDTKAMEYIGKVKKCYTIRRFLGTCSYVSIFICKLYRSSKGNFLLVHKEWPGIYRGKAINEAEAKTLLLENDYNKYSELYGPLKDA